MRFPLLFGTIAISLLFFKLFGMTNCPSCSMQSPLLPMLAAGYFTAFLICIFCFRSLPSSQIKLAGLVWSIGLAAALTYLSPAWCLVCLTAHACHIGMWVFWKRSEKKVGRKTSIVFTSSTIFATLFGLYFLSHGLQAKNSGVILHFVSPNCSYSAEQIVKLDAVAQEFRGKGFRFINISPALLPNFQALGPNLEWIEDREGKLISQYGIEEYPTMLFLDSKGKTIRSAVGSYRPFFP